jgi:putative ABC transport system permease protein
MNSLWMDLRYALRVLVKNPGFALAAVVTLALGIGANTAIFELINAVRLRTLPVKNPNELATVRIEGRKWLMGSTNGPYAQLTFPLWEQIRQRQQGFSAIAVWGEEKFNLAPGGAVRYVLGIYVSGEFFRVLGLEPTAGRLISPSDDVPGCGAGVVDISYAFWQRQFGGDASAIGKRLTLDGHSFEITGVTPASFHGVSVGDSFDVAVPACAESVINGEQSRLNVRHAWWLASIGRLKPGWSLEQATAHLRTISTPALEATIPPMYDADAVKHYMAYRLAAFPASTGFSDLRQQSEHPLWLLLGISGLVLLIACANLANLMLARASARERELVLRAVLGAGRSRLLRQLISESVLLSLVGTFCGILVAAYLSWFLIAMISNPRSPVFLDLTMDWRVLGFSACLAIVTTLLFGLTPAIRATRSSPNAILKSGARGITAGHERFGLRRALVTVQVALSTVLLVCALLFAGSFRKLINLDAGFRQNGILIASVDFTKLGIRMERRTEFKRELLHKIRAIPGVQSAADVLHVPVGGSSSNDDILGESETSGETKGSAWLNYVSPGFFETLGTPILEGRDFDDLDTAASPKVAMVNESFVRKFIGGSRSLGKTFRTWEPPGHPVPGYQIVGVVKDAKYLDLHDEFSPVMYFPWSQMQDPWPEAEMMIRSNLDLTSLTASVTQVIRDVSPSIDVDFRVFKTQIRESLVQDRLMALLSGFYGFLAALLAAIGLYGVVSYLVVQRTNEIGVRMALGAQRGDVLSMVLREGFLVTLVGLAAGTGLAMAAAQFAKSLLFGLKPRDPLTFAIAIVMLSAVAGFATYLPAFRASKLDPMEALRYE